MPYSRIENIVSLNCYGGGDGEVQVCMLFAFKSLVNHSKDFNVDNKITIFSSQTVQNKSIVRIYAARDIEAGEELLIDYCAGMDDDQRVEALKRYGIQE